MESLIPLAIRALYSEDFDFEEVATRLAGRTNQSILFRTYIAMKVAAKLTEPLCEADIGEAKAELLSERAEDFQRHFELQKELAEVFWLTKVADILSGKLAAQEDEYSYAGAVYNLEKSLKGPSCSEAREDFRRLSREYEEARAKLEDYVELKEAEARVDAIIEKIEADMEKEKRESNPGAE